MSVAQSVPVPVNALFDGDFITHLVLLLDTDTAAQAAEKVAALVVGVRVKAQDKPYALRFEGAIVPPGITLASAGVSPLSEVFVGYAD